MDKDYEWSQRHETWDRVTKYVLAFVSVLLALSLVLVTTMVVKIVDLYAILIDIAVS